VTAPRIHQLAVGPLEVLAYLVACPETGEAVLIDPAAEHERLAALAGRESARVRHVLFTHGHTDHLASPTLCRERWGCTTWLHAADVALFAREDVRAELARHFGLPPADPVDRHLEHGQVLEVGTLALEVRHTPGHTPGCCCFLVGGSLFSGDTLFCGAVGRTDLIGADLDELLASPKREILPLPDETTLWPGHAYGGVRRSTLGAERAGNPYITDFLLDG